MPSFGGITVEDVNDLLAPRHVDVYGLSDGRKSLIEARTKTFTTKAKLAERAGLKVHAIDRYEAGQSVPFAVTVPKVAAGLGEDPVKVAAMLLGVDLAGASFGELLRVHRMASGKDLKETAAELGATYTQLSQWERNMLLPATEKRMNTLIAACQRHFSVSEQTWRDAPERTTRVVDTFSVWLSGKIRYSGVSLRDLAALVGVKPQYVQAWTSGQWRPGDTRAAKLAMALNVPVAEMVDALAQPRPA